MTDPYGDQADTQSFYIPRHAPLEPKVPRESEAEVTQELDLRVTRAFEVQPVPARAGAWAEIRSHRGRVAALAALAVVVLAAGATPWALSSSSSPPSAETTVAITPFTPEPLQPEVAPEPEATPPPVHTTPPPAVVAVPRRPVMRRTAHHTPTPTAKATPTPTPTKTKPSTPPPVTPPPSPTPPIEVTP